MHKTFHFFLVLVNFASVLLVSSCRHSSMQPPVAQKKPVIFHEHGYTRTDEYFWLKERDNPEVIAYLEAENAYTGFWFKPLEKLKMKLYGEIVSRVPRNDTSVPYLLHGYMYYQRFMGDDEYPVYCRKKNTEGAREEIILDVNELARGHKFYSVAGLTVSPDARLLAYAADTLGGRSYILYVKDLFSGKNLSEEIPGTNGFAAWASDNKTLFYGAVDPVTVRSNRIMRHTLGTPASSDKLVFEEKDPTFNTFVFNSKSEEYLIIGSVSKTTSEYRLLPSNRPQGDFHLFSPRIQGLEYDIEPVGNTCFIRTNYKAENFCLMQSALPGNPPERWKELVPGNDSVLLEGFEVFDNYLVLQERNKGLVRFRFTPLNTMEFREIPLDDEAYSASLSSNFRLDTKRVRYTYSSLATPATVYEFDMETGQRFMLKQDKVYGAFDPSHYTVERFYVPAPDSRMIPLSLVYRTDKKKENMPLLLYGYGAYGISTEPDFQYQRLSLLDRGFVYAIAHVRGGEEMGRSWYEEGKLLQKQNTFRDFIRCAEFLIEKGYTSSDRLFAQGRSAGGLLMGVVVNTRPDLFKGVLAGVPFVDVLTDMLDESLPLTTSEYEEWGDPRIKEYYDYIRSYSPYDNVTAGKYPAMFVTAGLYDTQVPYWEPAKWVARLRSLKKDSNPILFYCNLDAGHSGSSGRYEKYKLTAMEYTFLLKLAGMEK